MANLNVWADHCGIGAPIAEKFVQYITIGDPEADLRAFAEHCDRLDLKRDGSLSINRRMSIYRQWLGTGHRCLLAVHDGRGEIVSASVVLPLTYEAYEAFWFEQRDSFEMGPAHLSPYSQGPPYPYILIEFLATNNRFVSTMGERRRKDFHGVGLRVIVQHLSIFSGRLQSERPVVTLCCNSRKVESRLLELGFEKGQSPAGNIFRADLKRHDWYSPDAQSFLDRCFAAAGNVTIGSQLMAPH